MMHFIILFFQFLKRENNTKRVNNYFYNIVMNDGKKKKPQKHQNKTAFKIQFDPLALDIHKKVSLNLLCARCADQINWKLQFNKYKKITQPGKCNYCRNKNVVRSYMKSCDPCAEKESVCPKCLDKKDQISEGEQVKLSLKQQAEKDKADQKALNEYIDSLKQRSRRKVKRQYEKGVITWDNQNKLFRDKEGNELVGLKFKRKGLQDLDREFQDNFSDEGSFEDEGKQEVSKPENKKEKKIQKQVKQDDDQQDIQDQQAEDQQFFDEEDNLSENSSNPKQKKNTQEQKCEK